MMSSSPRSPWRRMSQTSQVFRFFVACVIGYFAGIAIFSVLPALIGVNRPLVDLRPPQISKTGFQLERDVNDSASTPLTNPPQVLCVVQADRDPKTLATITSTWLPRCHTSLIYGLKANSSLTGSLPAGVQRLQQVLQAVSRLLERDQWMLLVDEKVYVIMENLQWLLDGLRSPVGVKERRYLGYALRAGSVVWNDMSAGVVLSAAAVRALVDAIKTDANFYQAPLLENKEDRLLGGMLSALGVYAEDTRDKLGNPQFIAVPPNQLFAPTVTSIFSRFFQPSVFQLLNGFCCSERAVSFGNTDVGQLLMLEYMLYRVTVVQTNEYRKPPTTVPHTIWSNDTTGSIAGATAGSAAGVTAGSAAGATAGSAAGVTAGTTAGNTAGTTAGSAAGATAGTTAGSAAGVTAGTTAKQANGTKEGPTTSGADSSVSAAQEAASEQR